MRFCKFEVRCTLLTIYVCKLLCKTHYSFDEMYDIESSARGRAHDFIERSPKYDPEKMFEWWENLETHLLNDNWEAIPEKDIKRMMVSWIMGAARREIIPCFSSGSSIWAMWSRNVLCRND